VEHFWRDVRYALRAFLSQPGFTCVAVLTLALGVGANTAIFSVVHAVLLQPLPYRDADRLVRVVEHVPAALSVTGQPERVASMAIDEFVEWRGRTRTLSHMALYAPMSMTLMEGAIGRDQAIRLRGARVSAATFAMLGLRPALGRVFGAAEETRGADAVVLLSAAAWKRHFTADPGIVGRAITLDDRQYSVIGVLGRDGDRLFPERDTEFWAPFVPLDPQTGRMIRAPLIARLADGVSRDAATQEANAIAPVLRGISPSSASSTVASGTTASGTAASSTVEASRFEVIGVQDQLVAPVRGALLVLMMAVGAVLLIACANVANLLLARNVSRQREIAIRGALGAKFGRLARQMLTESLVLAFMGGAAGLALAYGGVRAVKTLVTVEAPRWLASGQGSIGSILPEVDRIAIDGTVLMFTMAAVCITGVLCGLAPLMHLTGVQPIEAIKEGSAQGASGLSLFSRHRGRSLLVVAQLALATMLLVGAGLLIRSFVKLSQVDAGYDPHNVLTFQIVLPPRRLAASADDPRRQVFAEEMTRRIRALPGVRFAGFTHFMPLSTARWTITFTIPGVPPGAMREGRKPQTRYVSQSYLQAMGVRLTEGRWFSDEDAAGRANVLLVNQALARRFFPDRSPVKTMVSLNGEPWEIVGVVGDVRQGSLDEEAEPQWFIDFRQLPANVPFMPVEGGVFFAVRMERTDSNPLAAVTSIRALAGQLEPHAALDNVFAMDHLVASSLARPRFYAILLGLFASVAAGLAAVGIYGVLAYSVSQRTREIGIRMALGAPRRQVLALVLGQSAVLILAGIFIGIGGALFLTRYLTTMLFGLTPLDAPTFVGVAVAFGAVATIASYVPARRATNVDPLVALRNE
jgi:putative ABC transport system permease protein